MFILFEMNSYFGEVPPALTEQQLSPLGHRSVTPLEKTNMSLSLKGVRGFLIFRDRSIRLVESEAMSLVSGTNFRI